MTTRHARNAQIIRQWRILLALNDCRWWTLLEIMDAAKVSDRHKRTVMRDLDALMAVFPIDRRQGDVEIPRGKAGVGGFQFEYRLRQPLAAVLKRKK